MSRSQERHYCCGKGVWLFANRYGDPNGGPDYWQVRLRTSVVVLGKVFKRGERRWEARPANGGFPTIRATLQDAVMALCAREAA